jgi:hypothetical protein
MPFLDSATIRPLYDVHDGGPPKGFVCLAEPCITETLVYLKGNQIICGRVTRTLNGMRSHQRIVHGITSQQEFQFGSVQATTDQQNR